jgi:two-component system, sensor histidine kinase LadS
MCVVLWVGSVAFCYGQDSPTKNFVLTYWIDSTQQAGIAQASRQAFLPLQKGYNLGFVRYPVWVRLRFAHTKPLQTHLLEIRARVDTISLWQKDEKGVWTQITTGDKMPFRTRPLPHYNLLFSLALPAHTENEVYLRYKTLTQMKLKCTLWSEQSFREDNTQRTLFYGFLYGIMSLMIIYNVFVWWVVRDSAYLYYIGFAFFMLLVQSSQHLYQYVLGDFPIFNNNGVYYWVGCLNICSAHFARLFLDVRKYSRRAEKALLYASGYGVFIIICASFLDFPTVTLLIFTFNPFYTLFLVATGIFIWRRGNPYAGYYVGAWLAYVVGLVLLVLHNRNVIGDSFWAQYTLEISTLVEIVILSLAMSYKYKVINEEAQANRLEMQSLAYEQQRRQEENRFLQEKMQQEQAMHEEVVAFKDRELAMLMMQMLEKNNMLHDIQKQLQKIGTRKEDGIPDFREVGKVLQESLKLDGDWDKFRLHFEQVHPAFFEQLAVQYPQLTVHEQKTLAYIRINLSTKDIARLLNIEGKSVKMIKYRLKKKLNLTEDMDLENFVKKF